MLQVMRERMAGVVTGAIIIVLCLAFALWGVQYYLQAQGATNVVAKVNGVKISQAQFRAAFERARQELMTRMGKKLNFDQKTQQKLKKQVLDQMIKNEALLQRGKNLGFSVSDRQLDTILEGIPAFQIGGHFSQARFQQILSRMLFSEEDFFQNLQQTVIINQFQSGIARSAFVLPYEVSNLISLIKERRDIGYVVIPVERFLSSIKVSDADITKYYKNSAKQFVRPEQVSVSYIELSQEQLENRVKITSLALQQYYDDSIDIYSHPKQWQVSRIFVPLAATASSSDKKQALSKINSLMKLDSAYGKPAWLLKQQLPQELFKQLGKLKVGHVSKPVLTGQGYYLVKLLQVKVASTEPFAKVKGEVKKAYIQQQASKLFSSASDDLSDLTYTNSSSLVPAAKKLGLTIKTTSLFTRDGAKSGISSKPNVVQAAFSDSVLTQKYNSDIIEAGPGKEIVLRINKHITQAVKPLETVKLAIKQQLTQQSAQKQANALGAKMLQEIKSGRSASSVAHENGVVWNSINNTERKNIKVNQQILHAAFVLPLPKKSAPQTSGIALQDGDFAIVQTTAVHPGKVKDLTAKQLKVLKYTLALAFGMRDFQVYADEIMRTAKVKKYKS